MRRFTGLSRYSRAVAWLVVGAYMASVIAAVALGHYLLSLPTSWETIVLIVLTALFIGTRHRGVNNIIHECSHSTFADTRSDNTFLGSVCAALLLKSFAKYRDDHLSHHAHIGDYEMDHEFGPIAQFRLHEDLTVRTVLRHVVTPLTGRHLKVYTGINMSAEDGRGFFWLKITVLAAIGLFTVIAPLTSLIFVIVPLFYIYPTFNFWTDCLDHAGLVGATDELAASRNVLAPAPVRLLFFPRNDCYHLVHHLFPQIPARHLHSAHAELCGNPEYNQVVAASKPTHQGLPELLARSSVSSAD